MLGLYVSDHPLLGVEAALRRKVEQSHRRPRRPRRRGAWSLVGGVITGLARKFTKKGDQMAVFVLEDLEASIEVTVFPRTLPEQGHKLDDDVIVTVKGRLDRRDESRFGLIGQDDHRCWQGSTEDPAPPLRLKLPATSLDELKIHRLKRILRDHPGDSVVLIDIGQGKVLRLVRRVPRRHRPCRRRAADGVRSRSRRCSERVRRIVADVTMATASRCPEWAESDGRIERRRSVADGLGQERGHGDP